MRSVVLDIAKLGLVVGDEIGIELVNSLGQSHTTDDGYSFSLSVVLDSTTFTVELLENSLILSDTHYKLTLPSSIYFNFKLDENIDNTPHDLYSLLQIGCVKSVVYTHRDPLELNAEFVEKLNLYFTGENPHFSIPQQDIVDLYEYYADVVKDSTSTIDIIRKIDELLAQLGE